MGLDLECWNNLRDTSVISLLSQLIILTFLFSLFITNRKRGDQIKPSDFLLPFPILLLLLLFIFFRFIVCWKFLHNSISWVTKVSSLCFLHLLSMFSLGDCWWELFISLGMFYCHELMFIYWEISRIETV